MVDRPPTSKPDWLRPPPEQTGLHYYIAVLRERYVLVAAAVVVCLIAAGIYLATANKVYEAEADLLVTPASSDDALLAALGVPRTSSDPTRDVETAARFVTNVEVAERAKDQLDLNRSADSLLRDVTAEPVGQSAIVAITAKDSSASGAANLANAFAQGVVWNRTQALHQRADQVLGQIQAAQAKGTATESTGAVSSDALRTDLARLELLRNAPDPTVAVENQAVAPNSPASPNAKLTLAAAGFAGLVLGIAGAFAAQSLDPRLRREDQLRARYQLPILTRVPGQRSQRDRPILPAGLTPPTREAYRALRANIVASHWRERRAQSVLITGSAPSEGKTTTAINLAASLAMTGADTILIEADLRRPSIGRALGASPETGLVGTLLENVSLYDSVVRTDAFGPELKLLLAEYRGGWTSELFSPAATERLMREAKELADFVVIDSPPLTAVIDALPLAHQADDVVIVARPGVTRLDKLNELAELLDDNGIAPLGFAIIGAPQDEVGYSYYEVPDEIESERPSPRPAETAPAPTPVSESSSGPSS
jgi:capsular exopolysaccharide synthesis family protein